jgi:membrane-associated protein
MHYPRYLGFCIAGGIVWVTGLTLAGYYFGNLPLVKDNFELVIFAIIALSLVPAFIQFIRIRAAAKR